MHSLTVDKDSPMKGTEVLPKPHGAFLLRHGGILPDYDKYTIVPPLPMPDILAMQYLARAVQATLPRDPCLNMAVVVLSSLRIPPYWAYAPHGIVN